MYFLITRPLIDTQNLINRLPAYLTPICEPMIEISFPNIEADVLKLNLDDFEGIIFTSSNGVRAVSKIKSLHSLKVYTVGEKTALLARSFGFNQVTCLGASVEEAIKYITNSNGEVPQSLIYFSADKITKDLKFDLANFGYKIKQLVVYHTKPTNFFSHELLLAFKSHQIKAVSFYSGATALNYIRLASQYKLKENHRKIEAFALSEQVADILMQIQWLKVHIANRPTDNEMIKLVRNSYEKQ